MRSVTNPANFYVTGSTQKKFTFEPGDKLFQVQIRGSASWIPANFVLMAFDKPYVEYVLISMCNFRLACHEEFVKHTLEFHPEEIASIQRRETMIELTKNIKRWISRDREGLPDGFEISITQAPLNQVYKTSWASNEYILD